jgi:hypothetical protein
MLLKEELHQRQTVVRVPQLEALLAGAHHLQFKPNVNSLVQLFICFNCVLIQLLRYWTSLSHRHACKIDCQFLYLWQAVGRPCPGVQQRERQPVGSACKHMAAFTVVPDKSCVAVISMVQHSTTAHLVS